MFNEVFVLEDVYKLHALKNGLPVYCAERKAEGDFFEFAMEDGTVDMVPARDTFDEMIAKIINTLFCGKKFTIAKSIVNRFIKQKDAESLERELILAMEEDIGVEICQVGNQEGGELVFRFKEKNILDMEARIVPYDNKNEIHVAYTTLRNALKTVAEELCK